MPKLELKASGQATANPSYAYWNDPSVEQAKIFALQAKEEMSAVESAPHLQAIYRQASELLSDDGIPRGGRVLSLGSGTCWLEAWLFSRIGAPSHFSAVDFSFHRIHEIAPNVIRHYGHTYDAELIHGDMTDLGWVEQRYDLVLLAQALHHVPDPISLLRRIAAVLAPNGRVIIVGEPWFSETTLARLTARHFAKYIINYRDYRSRHNLMPGFRDLFPPSLEKGDVHYSKAEYYSFFDNARLQCDRHSVDSFARIQGFRLRRTMSNHDG